MEGVLTGIPDLSPYITTASRLILPIMAVWVLARCMRSMLREKYEPEIWGYLISKDGVKTPINHWECIIGRSRSADVVVDAQSVSGIHATLMRDDGGAWLASDVDSKNGVCVNGERVDGEAPFRDGDRLSFGREEFTFEDISAAARERLESRRTPPGRFIGPGVTLLILTIFQAFLALEFTVTGAGEQVFSIELAFLAIVMAQWSAYLMMRSIRRTGYEPETLAFFLTTLGVAVAASSAPEEMFKETVLVVMGIALFLLMGWWLRDLRRVKATRSAAAVAAIGLLMVNVALSEAVFGAKNWLSIAGVSLQPSELVKVLYIYTGAATLDRLFARRNLIWFIAFSAVCVIALALIGDFGAAVIFFATFLVMAFMRSGSFATVFLAVSGAGMAGFLMLYIKPYIAQRFATWGHVWEDVWGAGYQQTHALSAAASGGLFGRGAGSGSLKNVFAANTDMVFAVVSEELGLIVALCAVLAVVALCFFAVRNAALGRSTYYVIAGCAAVTMMTVQMALNVFGTLDILPFTGVTFPFVSKGGTSLLSCWMLLAFVKASDTRRGASFSVRADRGAAEGGEDEDEDEEDGPEDGDEDEDWDEPEDAAPDYGPGGQPEDPEGEDLPDVDTDLDYILGEYGSPRGGGRQ